MYFVSERARQHVFLSKDIKDMFLQDSLSASRQPFCCASAEAVKAAAAAQSLSAPLLRPAPLLTAAGNLAPSHRHPMISGPSGKRLASEADRVASPAVKKQRTLSELGISASELGLDARTASQSKQAELASIPSGPKARRVVPEQILPVLNSNAAMSSRLEGVHEILPEETNHDHRISSSSKRLDPSACQVSSTQRPSQHAMPTLHSHLAAVRQHPEEDEGDCSTSEGSSYDGSEEGSEEASEGDGGSDEGSEGGSEGGQPSKVIVEFGAAGDAWWHDFIAAKEEMLNDVLQVRLYLSPRFTTSYETCRPHALHKPCVTSSLL